MSSVLLAGPPSAAGRDLRPGEQAPTQSAQRMPGLLAAHFEAVWSTLRRLGVAGDSLDDAAQEVFIIAARKLENVELAHERAFLFSIALGVAANRRRAQRSSREQPNEDALRAAASESPAADALLEEKQLRHFLDQILDGFTPELRTAFVLFEFEGFSEREIAELCAVPLGTVASRLRRARAAFQEAAQRLKRHLYARGSL
jgi:RNA polymerase sigma-70 factor (ECF subfamily)